VLFVERFAPGPVSPVERVRKHGGATEHRAGGGQVDLDLGDDVFDRMALAEDATARPFATCLDQLDDVGAGRITLP